MKKIEEMGGDPKELEEAIQRRKEKEVRGEEEIEQKEQERQLAPVYIKLNDLLEIFEIQEQSHAPLIKERNLSKEEESAIQQDYLVEQIAKGAQGMKHKASKFGEIIRSDN